MKRKKLQTIHYQSKVPSSFFFMIFRTTNRICPSRGTFKRPASVKASRNHRFPLTRMSPPGTKSPSVLNPSGTLGYIASTSFLSYQFIRPDHDLMILMIYPDITIGTLQRKKSSKGQHKNVWKLPRNLLLTLSRACFGIAVAKQLQIRRLYYKVVESYFFPRLIGHCVFGIVHSPYHSHHSHPWSVHLAPLPLARPQWPLRASLCWRGKRAGWEYQFEMITTMISTLSQTC